MVGYNGPIYMTHPTKAICPILLEDYRKITVERRGGDKADFFTEDHIKQCMAKVIPVDLHQTVVLGEDFELKAYYAGHVLGAAMFYVRAGNQSVLYTGDYNMTPDRHLGAAWVDRCLPDVVITESTYATTIRDSKRSRERDLLEKVHRCVNNGGKVLIPVFALGRAQELCILLETYWQRKNLTVPIYFSAGLTERANQYYRMFITWMNQKIKDTFVDRNMFDFKHIRPFDRSFLDHPGPQVLFATPGMLHAGTSLQAFVRWADDPRNMVILPGYCVAGTVGAKVIAGLKTIQVDANTTVEVRLAVEHLSFSAHADAKGIMQLIHQCGAKQVVLVHGEKAKMAFLAEKIRLELQLPCYFPPNGQMLEIATHNPVPVLLSTRFLDVGGGLLGPSGAACSPAQAGSSTGTRALPAAAAPTPEGPGAIASQRIRGVLVRRGHAGLQLLTVEEAEASLGLTCHRVQCSAGWAPALSLPDLQARLETWLAEEHPNASLRLRPDGALAVRSLVLYPWQDQVRLDWESIDDSFVDAMLAAVARS
jgi:integrator complex subunit 11